MPRNRIRVGSDLTPREVSLVSRAEIAVSKGHSSLAYVPKEMQTPGLKMKALLQNNKAERYIKKEKPNAKST